MNSKPIRLGKHMANALIFATNNPGWNTYAHRNYSTVTAIKRLASHKLVEINEFYQFRKTK